MPKGGGRGVSERGIVPLRNEWMETDSGLPDLTLDLLEGRYLIPDALVGDLRGEGPEVGLGVFGVAGIFNEEGIFQPVNEYSLDDIAQVLGGPTEIRMGDCD